MSAKRGESGLNLIVGINKAAGMTSHDVVDRVRRILGERRVGHAGTLDPAATGVMVVGVGQGTRLMGHLTADTKSYLAQIAFGSATNTDDAEGEVIRVADVPPTLLDRAFANEVLARFTGPQMQVPPAFSAISVGGRRAYAKARAGEEVELAARPVTVSSAELIAILDGEPLSWQCAFVVSKGTYIRALARDVGVAVGSAAHLAGLCRTSSGSVTLGQCVTLEQLKDLGPAGVEEVALDPVRALGHRVRVLTDKEAHRVFAGQSLVASADECEGEVKTMLWENRVVGLWRVEGGLLRPIANFPTGITGAGGMR